MRTKIICILCLLPLVLGGCIVSGAKTQIAPQITSLFDGEYKVDPYFEKSRPRTVAVMPFVNRAESQQGSEAVRRGFYNHFSSLPYRDMELDLVDSRLKKAGLSEADKIAAKSPQELGKILEVDAVIFGEISNFDKLYAAVYSQVSVGADVKMFDTKTGHFLWSGKHVARIHEGGLSVSPIGIVATVIATAINVRDIQLLRACDDLFRDMVKTIPRPTDEESLRPPTMILLTQDTKGAPKKAGDEIKVVMQGDKGMNATFDIGDFRKGIIMREMEPGWYLGSYKVLPGDNVAKAVITGHLKDAGGARADWVDALGSVTLDTTPPAKPRAVVSAGRNTFINLKWEKGDAKDLAGYGIYRSDTPLSGYKPVTKTEFNEYRDQGLTNSRKYFYRVSAFDFAGNESELSEAVAGMPVAPGPTRVAGQIETDTTWYSGAGPYIIDGPIRVLDKAVLTIEPGCEIRSRGGEILVEGSLKALGDEQNLIIFDAAEGQGWKGITFSSTREKENVLKHCAVRNARTGVLCNASSPRIEDCEFSANGTGIRIEGSFSKPLVSGNSIMKNRELGVEISSAAQPVLEKNRISDNAQGGILVSESTPNIYFNWISRNQGPGIEVRKSQPIILRNNIFDNLMQVAADREGAAVNARDNWWGTVHVSKILSGIRGRVDINPILDGPSKGAKSIVVPLLSEIPEKISIDSYLLLSNSPYKVKKETLIDNGATLVIEPGVVIRYERGSAIIVKNGGIMANGTAAQPIVFTGAGSDSPGFYRNAVRISEKTSVNSSFRYCVFRLAETAIDIYYGSPEIYSCEISRNSQSGIYCRNDSAPIISYNTFRENSGEGAIKCVGMSRPKISYNSFEKNALAVQAFSSMLVDARHNWWGSEPPDSAQIWGSPEGIQTEPHLAAPDPKVFAGAKDMTSVQAKQ